MNERAKVILDFWFIETPSKLWFTKDLKFDKKIKKFFYIDYQQASKNKLDKWIKNPRETLALILLLDQFSRNLYRKDKRAFENDAKARLILKKAKKRNYLENYTFTEVHFMILPLMHSEDINDHDLWKNLSEKYLKKHPSFKEIKKYADRHKYIIERFKRYPHRNKLIKRKSTNEEINFLKEPMSSF